MLWEARMASAFIQISQTMCSLLRRTYRAKFLLTHRAAATAPVRTFSKTRDFMASSDELNRL
jgi:hypothetical protein